MSMGKIILEAWYKHTMEAHKQREYFEVGTFTNYQSDLYSSVTITY